MDQELIRKNLQEYLHKSGVSQLHICQQTGIPTYILSRFKRGTKSLWDCDLLKLQEYLETHIAY